MYPHLHAAQPYPGTVLVVGFKEVPAVAHAVITALGGELLVERVYARVVEEQEQICAEGGRVEHRGDDQVVCSFCGKAEGQVKKLVAGPGIYICNECVDVANEIID
jgi:hypothetical protein